MKTLLLFALVVSAFLLSPVVGMFAACVAGSALSVPNTAHGALVQLTDRFIPAVYGTLTSLRDVQSSAFVQSGVVVRDPAFDALARAGSKTISVPYWGLLSNSTAPNLSDDSENSATPLKIAQADYDARVSYYNQLWKAADLAGELGLGNPMQAIKDKVEAYWTHQFQYHVLAVAKGIKAENAATDSSDMIHTVALETTVGQSATNWISRDNVVSALATFGDAFGQTGVIAMHSVPYFRLVRDEEIEFRKPSEGGEDVPYYLGKRVIVDDGMPAVAGSTSGVKYTSIIFGSGAIKYGVGTPLKPDAVERKELEGNGAGTETLVTRKTWLIHPVGHDFQAGSVAGVSPTFAELALAANWDRVESRKAVPIAFLETNG